MGKIFVAEIQPNQEIGAALVVAEKELRVAKNGKPFLTIKFVDRTGTITGRVWEHAEQVASRIAPRSVVFVRARSETFRDELQLHVQEIVPVPIEEIDPGDFVPVCPKSVPELLKNLKRLISNIRRKPLQQLIRQLLRDQEFMERFQKAPAAKSMHHAYLGGLLEHTVAVMDIVYRITEAYPELDRDILLTGALLHDVGKIDEFDYELYIDYSNAGRLLGHMVLGVQILEDKIRLLPAFPQEEALILKHLILSHHGEAEFGAVKLPVTREAFVLHFADDLDAKMNSLSRILSEEGGAEELWTAYQPLFNRFFFRGFPAQTDLPTPGENEVTRNKTVQLSIWPGSSRNPE